MCPTGAGSMRGRGIAYTESFDVDGSLKNCLREESFVQLWLYFPSRASGCCRESCCTTMCCRTSAQWDFAATWAMLIPVPRL